MDALDELERLVGLATPGKWYVSRLSSPRGAHKWLAIGTREAAEQVCRFSSDDRSDPDLIVALRNAAPTLLASLRAARGLIAAVEHEQDWGDANLDPDNFGCSCEGTVTSDPLPEDSRPCSSCRARATKRAALALRAAIDRIDTLLKE